METVGYKANEKHIKIIGKILKSLPKYKFQKVDSVDVIQAEKSGDIYIVTLPSVSFILCSEEMREHIPNDYEEVEDLNELPIFTLTGNYTNSKSELEKMRDHFNKFMDESPALDDINEQVDFMSVDQSVDIIKLFRKEQCNVSKKDVKPQQTSE